MPIQNYLFRYWNGSTFVALNNVQNISIQHGRQRQLDAYQAARCTANVWYPNGYASPITQLIPGCWVQVITDNAVVFAGRIADVEVEYGIPYQSNVGNADYLRIIAEGNFAEACRTGGNSYVLSSAKISTQIAAMETETDIEATWSNPNQFDPVLSSYTVSSSWGEWINRALTSVNGRLWDGFDPVNMTLVSPFYDAVCGFNFSDTANNATNQVYDQITFASYADNYYTQVTVDPDTLSPVTVTASGATPPYRTLQTNTLNSTTGQATDYASYLVNNFSSTAPKIVSVSCLAEAQNTFKLDQCGAIVPYGPGGAPGNRVSVIFRGTTTPSVIEGVSINATPEGSRWTFYLSGADLNAYLLLNNSVFGKLNENRLGY